MSKATIRIPLDASTARALGAAGAIDAARGQMTRVVRAARAAPARAPTPAPPTGEAAGPEEGPIGAVQDRRVPRRAPSPLAGHAIPDGHRSEAGMADERLSHPEEDNSARTAPDAPARSEGPVDGPESTRPAATDVSAAVDADRLLATTSAPGDTFMPGGTVDTQTAPTVPERPATAPPWTEDLTAGAAWYPAPGTTIHIGVLYSAAPLDRALNTLTRTS